MIITILSLILFIAGVGLLIYSFCLKDLLNETRDVLFLISLSLCLIGGVFSIICGSISICNNSRYTCITEKIKYEEKVTELNTTYDYLMTYNDETYARYTAIQQYNSEVEEFKTNILKKQATLKDPWVCWFECKEYNNMDANSVKYISL